MDIKTDWFKIKVTIYRIIYILVSGINHAKVLVLPAMQMGFLGLPALLLLENVTPSALLRRQSPNLYWHKIKSLILKL